MGEYMEIDVSEAIESKEGGFWFDFEQALVNKDSRDDQVYSEGDLSSAPSSHSLIFSQNSLTWRLFELVMEMCKRAHPALAPLLALPLCFIQIDI